MKIRPDAPKVQGLTIAGAAAVGEYYFTAQSAAKVLALLVGPAPRYGEYILRTWCPDYEEWHDVKVDATYKLQKIKEGTVKIPKTSAPTKEAGKKVTKSSGKKVPAVWYEAFKQFGLDKSAVAKITAFMKKELPEKDTNWEKWVDLVRGRYNRGEIGPAPKAPLPPYNGKRSK